MYTIVKSKLHKNITQASSSALEWKKHYEKMTRLRNDSYSKRENDFKLSVEDIIRKDENLTKKHGIPLSVCCSEIKLDESWYSQEEAETRNLGLPTFSIKESNMYN